MFDSGSSFINNKGGACCFLKSIADLNDCEFVDNNGTFDDLVNKSSKVFGGAVYSSEKKIIIWNAKIALL